LLAPALQTGQRLEATIFVRGQFDRGNHVPELILRVRRQLRNRKLEMHSDQTLVIVQPARVLVENGVERKMPPRIDGKGLDAMQRFKVFAAAKEESTETGKYA
jgi:hypothetical protein